MQPVNLLTYKPCHVTRGRFSEVVSAENRTRNLWLWEKCAERWIHLHNVGKGKQSVEVGGQVAVPTPKIHLALLIEHSWTISIPKRYVTIFNFRFQRAFSDCDGCDLSLVEKFYRIRVRGDVVSLWPASIQHITYWNTSTSSSTHNLTVLVWF